MKTICFVTTTRADFGILKPLIQRLSKQSEFSVKLIVTGTHLSKLYGSSIQEIEDCAIPVFAKIEILSQNEFNNPLTFLSQIIEKVGATLEKLKPDLLFLLGDRYETVGLGLAASLLNIPIAHIAGGDLTLGAYDDAFRHALTKLSHLHFPTNAAAQKRIVQMGENPKNVHNLGHLGLEAIKQTNFLNRNELTKELNINFQTKNFLITYHPVTNAAFSSSIENFFAAMKLLPKEYGLIFTAPNADHHRDAIMTKINELLAKRSNVYFFESLGSLKYLSLLKECDLCLGNSSSGIYEAPFLGTPTVNIGNRQMGRAQAETVVQAQEETQDILKAVETAIKLKGKKIQNPYGDGNTSEKIITILNKIENFQKLLEKNFYEP